LSTSGTCNRRKCLNELYEYLINVAGDAGSVAPITPLQNLNPAAKK
jgi:hypothetical protein